MEGEEPSGQAVEWAEELAFKPEGFKLAVKIVRGALTHALARYTKDNDELDAAEELFESVAAIYRELESWDNYLAARSRAASCSVLKAGSLEELKERAKTFESLWREAKEHEKEADSPLVYFRNEAVALAGYLVSLALEGRVDEVSRLLEEEGWLLRRFPHVGVAARLLLERLGVNVGKPEAWEVAVALGDRIVKFWLFVLSCLLTIAIEAVQGDGKAVRVEDARAQSLAAFVLMLWALSSGDEELARALAKLASITIEEKLPRRLFREAAEARGERFKLALLKLFYLHF
jgi:hypothetical protein